MSNENMVFPQDEQDKHEGAVVPYFVYEAEKVRADREMKQERERNERTVKRLAIALIVAVVLTFAQTVAWLIYESQFDTISYSQDGAGINNINTGEQGDVLGEPKTTNQKAP